MSVAQRMTVDEFLELREDGVRRQLVDGEIVVTDPLLSHQLVVGDLYVALRQWTDAQPGRGLTTLPIDSRLDEHNCFAPDVLWYSQSRIPRDVDIRPQALPDLAVEVRSPSTWRYDIGAKKARYEQHGLAELWLVDTAAREVIVFGRSTPGSASFDVSRQLTAANELASPLLPGFALPLSGVFTVPG